MKSLNYQHNHLLPTFKPQALMFLSLGVLVERFSQSYEILSVQLQLTIQGFNLSFIYYLCSERYFSGLFNQRFCNLHSYLGNMAVLHYFK